MLLGRVCSKKGTLKSEELSCLLASLKGAKNKPDAKRGDLGSRGFGDEDWRLTAALRRYK